MIGKETNTLTFFVTLRPSGTKCIQLRCSAAEKSTARKTKAKDVQIKTDPSYDANLHQKCRA